MPDSENEDDESKVGAKPTKVIRHKYDNFLEEIKAIEDSLPVVEINRHQDKRDMESPRGSIHSYGPSKTQIR